MENVFRPSWYTKLEKKERVELVQTLNATAHHLTQVIIAIINILYLCDKVGGQFRCDSRCLLTYKPFVSHAGMFTLGYFAYDLIIILFVVRDKSAVTQQLIIHHVVSSLTFSFSLIEGKHLVALSQSVMLCEISTLFLNIRYSMGKDAEGLFPTINSTCLFLSFTFTRVTYFPMHINAHF